MRLFTSYISKFLFISFFGIFTTFCYQSFECTLINPSQSCINFLCFALNTLCIFTKCCIPFSIFWLKIINHMCSHTSLSQSKFFLFLINFKWHWFTIPKQLTSSFIVSNLTTCSSGDLHSLNTLWYCSLIINSFLSFFSSSHE